MSRLILTLVVVYGVVALAGRSRGLVEDSSATNSALLVGVAHGLPGIDIDVNNIELMAKENAYKYEVTHINDTDATTKTLPPAIARAASAAGNDGSFFFYFSGHGSSGSIYLQDTSLSVAAIRSAIESGRKMIGPLSRLILMFDSCYSGSLLGPFNRLLPQLAAYNPETASQIMVDQIAGEFLNRGRAYWNKLFVFASSRSDETSLAGDNGSIFTVALKKAFDETFDTNATMREWIEKTKTYTKGHHPVERLVPKSLYDETMDPMAKESAG